MMDNFVRLQISDNGPGMSLEVRQRAFEPLFTTKPAGLGTGLGLPLCKTIAEAHGGPIRIESARGGGTAVQVVLPLDAMPG
jgi:signal transduction histidine kinase